MAQVAAQPRPSLRRPTTWLFDLTLQLPAFLSAEDICLVFLVILEDTQSSRLISGLQDLSYYKTSLIQCAQTWRNCTHFWIFARGYASCLCGASLWTISMMPADGVGGLSLCWLYSLQLIQMLHSMLHSHKCCSEICTVCQLLSLIGPILLETSERFPLRLLFKLALRLRCHRQSLIRSW